MSSKWSEETFEVAVGQPLRGGSCTVQAVQTSGNHRKSCRKMIGDYSPTGKNGYYPCHRYAKAHMQKPILSRVESFNPFFQSFDNLAFGVGAIIHELST